MSEITEPAKQMAADLANAERERLGHAPDWAAKEFELGSVEIALSRLCARFLAMQADMAEIAEQADGARTTGPAWASAALDNIRVIAARYRVEADPLLIEARKLVAARSVNAVPDYSAEVLAGTHDAGADVQWAHEAIKRGIALGAAK